MSIYICKKCMNILKNNFSSLNCLNCGVSIECINNEIPLFYSPGEKKDINLFGLATKLFSSPTLYDFMIKIKTFIAPDAFIGINEFVKNKIFLNIGCGSNITAKNLEYDIKEIKEIYALDSSKEFILAASERFLNKKYISFLVASADDLPFADKIFDVSMLAFVLHHLPFPLHIALNEAARVTKGELIIFDHIKSSNYFLGLIQSIYWNIFDGGTQYLTKNEWDIVLKDFIIIKRLRTGKIGLHVIKLVIIKKDLVI